MQEAFVFTDRLEGLIAQVNGTAIGPDDTVTQYFLFLIHAHKTVHLVRYSYCFDSSRIIPALGVYFKDSELYMFPPHFGGLLCPSMLYRDDFRFSFRVLGTGYTLL